MLYNSHFQIHEGVDKVKAQLEIDELSDDPDDIAKVLLKMRHECERALENINQSINNGRSIVEHVTQGTQDVKSTGSCEHLEELISGLEAKKNVLEMAWIRRREQMELWQQLWEFERDGEQVHALLLYILCFVRPGCNCNFYLDFLFLWMRTTGYVSNVPIRIIYQEHVPIIYTFTSRRQARLKLQQNL